MTCTYHGSSETYNQQEKRNTDQHRKERQPNWVLRVGTLIVTGTEQAISYRCIYKLPDFVGCQDFIRLPPGVRTLCALRYLPTHLQGADVNLVASMARNELWEIIPEKRMKHIVCPPYDMKQTGTRCLRPNENGSPSLMQIPCTSIYHYISKCDSYGIILCVVVIGMVCIVMRGQLRRHHQLFQEVCER